MIPFSNSAHCTPLMLKQSSLCFVNTFLLLKHSKKLLEKYFLFLFLFLFVKHKSVKIFDVYTIRFITINYMQQIHRVFKFLIRNVNQKNQTILATKHVNANIILFFNLAKVFFLNTKVNSIIFKIISKFFIFLCNFFWMYFYGINMPNITPRKSFCSFFFFF